MRRFIRKLGKSFRYGEKGFTLIELLIVVAILGILAAIILPNVGGFLRSGNLAAANTEAAQMKTACAAYYSEDYAGDGLWPTDSDLFYPAGYLDRAPTGSYTFSGNGTIIDSASGWDNFQWNKGEQQWEPIP